MCAYIYLTRNILNITLNTDAWTISLYVTSSYLYHLPTAMDIPLLELASELNSRFEFGFCYLIIR